MWVLIIFFYSVYGNAITTQEFSSQDRCEFAKKLSELHNEKFAGGTTDCYCVQK